MRKILFMIGAPACGKSTLTRNLKTLLEEDRRAPNISVLSLDTFREIMCPAQHDINGDTVLLAGRNRKLYFEAFDQALEAHILAGDTIIVDNTNARLRDFQEKMHFARRHGYDVAGVKFEIPTEILIDRDIHRIGIHKVGADVIRTIQARIDSLRIPSEMKLFTVEQNTDLNKLSARIVNEFFETPLTVLSDSPRYIIVGDVHATAHRLTMLEQELQPSDHIVFCGDILDRGPDPVKTLDIIERTMTTHPVTFVEGNHDEHMRRLLNTRSNEELKKRFHETWVTVQQLNATGNGDHYRELLKRIIESSQLCVSVETDSKTFFVSHAGIAPVLVETIVESGYIPAWMSANDFIFGACQRDVYNKAHPSDYRQETLDSLACAENLVQVHGHRGLDYIPDLTPNHVNLDSHVWDEKGCLSALIVTSNGKMSLRTYH